MKKAIMLTLAAALAVSIISGCAFVIVVFADSNAITGTGDLEKFELKVGEYNGIKIEGHCEVRYYAAPSDTVTLELQPNLRDHYVVEVIGGELVVRTTRRISFGLNKTPVLTVSTPELNSLTVEGAFTFIAHDKITAGSLALNLSGAGEGRAELDVGRLTINASGASTFRLSGSADTADMNISGAGELDALSLQTREAVINLSGVGTVRISCSDNLRVNAGGVGTVEYKGSPALDISRGGLVSVKKLD